MDNGGSAVVGNFKRSEQGELANVLLSLADAYLKDIAGAEGMFEASIETSRPRIDSLSGAARAAKGSKGLEKAKHQAMTYIWQRLSEDPKASFKGGSPAKLAYDRFRAYLDVLVVSDPSRLWFE